MRVLITGNKGYIGTVLTGLLANSGHDIVGLDSDLFRGCSIAPIEPVSTIVKDIRDTELDDFAGIEAVVHLAALSNDPLGDLDPALTDDINHLGAVRVAELAKAAGVARLVFTSSCSVYGEGGQDWLYEDAPFNPVTAYARAKAAAEKEIAELADEQFTVTFLRPATAYGVSPMIRFDLVVNNLVAWASATGRVHLKSDGGAWRPLVHAEDIGRAVTAVLAAPASTVQDQVFNVGITEQNFRIVDVAKAVEETVPDAVIEYASDASPDRRCYRVNFGKIARTLSSFAPRWRMIDGAAQVYKTIRALELGTEDFEGPSYSRLAHIKQLLNTGRLDSDLRWPAPPKGAKG
jgi:nucleoside-diphosphate-sugar epimerase